MALFLSVLTAVLGGWSLGILPPQYVAEQKYQACLRQARVPEVLKIKVLAVDRDIEWCPSGPPGAGRRRRKGSGGNGNGPRTWRYQNLTVYAQVLAVKKSATGLKAGSLVQFSYRLFHLCPRMVGPSNRPQPDMLRVGDVTWALLERARSKPLRKPGGHALFSDLIREAKGAAFGRYWLAAGAKSFVAQPPTFPSLKEWDAHCDKLYPHRAHRVVVPLRRRPPRAR